MPPNPPSNAHGFAMRSMSLRDMQIPKSEKTILGPPPPKSWGRPCLLSGDGHGFMNCYRTLTLIEIHKLPTLVMIVFKKCAKAGHVSWCDLVTYVTVSFHI